MSRCRRVGKWHLFVAEGWGETYFPQQQSAPAECSMLLFLRENVVLLLIPGDSGELQDEQIFYSTITGMHRPRPDGHLTTLTRFRCVAC